MNSSTSSSDRRGARVFAAVLAAACAGTLVLACAALRAFYERPNWKTLAAAQVGPAAEILFLGSSTFYFGIDPRLYGRPVVSLGANYQSFASMRSLWEQHGERLAGVQAAVLELNLCSVLYETAALDRKSLRDLGLDLRPGPRDFARDFDGAVRELLWPLFTWRLTPLFAREFAFRTEDDAEPQAAVPGFIPSTLALAASDLYAEREVAKARKHVARFGEAHREDNLAAARALIQALQARGIPVALVRMPQAEALRRIFPPEWEDAVAAAQAALAASVPPDAVWDLRAPEGFADDAFRDPDHLNAAGAARLAPLLRERIEALTSSSARTRSGSR